MVEKHILALPKSNTRGFDVRNEEYIRLRCRRPCMFLRPRADMQPRMTLHTMSMSRGGVVRETKQSSLMDGSDTGLISQHLHPVFTPPRPAEPSLEACVVCDLPLPVACVCTYTRVHLANEFSALAAHAHVSYKVHRQRNDLFELVEAQHESESLLLGSQAPVYV